MSSHLEKKTKPKTQPNTTQNQKSQNTNPAEHKTSKQRHNFPQANNFSWRFQAQMDYFKYHINLL